MINRKKKGFSGNTSTENERRKYLKKDADDVSKEQEEFEEILEVLRPEEDPEDQE